MRSGRVRAAPGKLRRVGNVCAQLDPVFEKELAEEGLAEDFADWPDY